MPKTSRYFWVLVALPLGCGGATESGEPCLVLPSLRAPDALQPSPTSSCGEPVFGAAALELLNGFLDALDEQVCAQAVRCGVHLDVESCRQARPAIRAPSNSFRVSIAAGRTGVVPDATRTLIDWLAPPEGCNGPTSSQVFESALQLAFPGRGALGDACAVSTDCAGVASRCDRSACDDDACCSGVCVAYRRGVGEGERCVIDECGPGLDCYFVVGGDAAPGDGVARCHPALREGAECTGDFGENCELGTSCRFEPDGTSSCQVNPPMLGETCGDASGWQGCGGLDVGCRDASVCAARQPVGSPCSSDDDCLRLAACIAGQCTTRLGSGAVCDPTTNACAEGLDCNVQTGTCELRAINFPDCSPEPG